MKSLSLICSCTILLSTMMLAQSNPVPFINNPLSPASAVPGGPGFTLTVNGAGFVSSSVVNWNGSALATTFVSGSRVTATVPASNIGTAGTASVTVVSPTPGGGKSNVDFFEVRQPFTAVSFGESLVTTGDDPAGVYTLDLNNDGKLDLVTIDRSDTAITTLLGNGDGTFQFVAEYTFQHGAFSIATGDFNGDGNPDIVVGTSNAVAVLLGNGNGTFQPEQDFPVPFSQGGYSIVTGDFNADGALDVAVVNGGQPNVFVLLGNGDGSLQNAVSYVAGTYVLGLTTGDFNRDGRLDIAVTDTADLAVLLGNGDGTFQAPVHYTTPPSPFVVVTADVNGDGVLDLVAQCYPSPFTVLLGNGDGTFRAHVDHATQGGNLWLTLADLNGDGILDVIVPNSVGSTTSTYLGNGNGTFQSQSIFPEQGSAPGFAAIGDFNGDGILDMAVADGKAHLNFLPGTTSVLSTTSLNFGTIHLGRSAQLNVTLTNIGSVAFTINRIYISGLNPSDFGTRNNCGASLAAGASCDITVVFKPEGRGNFHATLQITDSAVKGFETVYLAGSGL
jgi:hypothetical protein